MNRLRVFATGNDFRKRPMGEKFAICLADLPTRRKTTAPESKRLQRPSHYATTRAKTRPTPLFVSLRLPQRLRSAAKPMTERGVLARPWRGPLRPLRVREPKRATRLTPPNAPRIPRADQH